MSEQNKTPIEFTTEEANQLIKILDFAVKQIGISDGGELANDAIYFANKINKSFVEEQKP